MGSGSVSQERCCPWAAQRAVGGNVGGQVAGHGVHAGGGSGGSGGRKKARSNEKMWTVSIP